MVTNLAELLRYSLASDRVETVPLEDEIDIGEEYLNLESVRLEERLRVDRQIAPKVSRTPVPPMLVQMLVENAIKHGIAERPEGGLVRIQAAALPDDAVEIIVANSGRLKTPAPGGLGLENLKGRLKLIYGDDATFTIGDRGEMVEARVVLPIERR